VRLVLQRVDEARVEIDGRVIGQIQRGLLALIGMGKADTPSVLGPMLTKLLNLRIFPDDGGNMNRSLLDVSGDLLLVSQFTLYADCRKGRRPGFSDAAPPADARALYDQFVTRARQESGLGTIATGEFGAMMRVHLVNAGPVTILLDSAVDLA